jgi:transposase
LIQTKVCPLGRPSKYAEELRRDAVELVRSSQRPINQVARKPGMSHETLRNWGRAAERQIGTGPTASDGGGGFLQAQSVECGL